VISVIPLSKMSVDRLRLPFHVIPLAKRPTVRRLSQGASTVTDGVAVGSRVGVALAVAVGRGVLVGGA
jgi:hypothetical protein